MDRAEELRRRRGEHTRSYSQDKPIGSGDNAKSIVRGVKQWLPDIPGAVGDLADMLYAGGANVLQGQKRRSIAPLGAGPAIRRAIAKKSPLEQAEMRATPETDWVEEGVRFANPAMFMSPKNIAQLGGLALAGGVPGAAMAVAKPRGGNWYTGSGSEMESAIKGTVQNLAPKAEYLPFVRDFLSSPYHDSSWQDAIGDLNSLGLSPEDIEKIPRAYAQGGLVGRQEFNGAVGYILD